MRQLQTLSPLLQRYQVTVHDIVLPKTIMSHQVVMRISSQVPLPVIASQRQADNPLLLPPLALRFLLLPFPSMAISIQELEPQS